MSREFGPVAELFATLGLDATQLDEALRASKVKFESLGPAVTDIDTRLAKLGQAFNPAVISAAFDQLTAKGMLFEEQLNAIYAAAIKVNAAQQGPRELVSLENEDVVDAKIAAADLKRAKLEQSAADAQVVEMRKSQAAQLKAINAEVIAERARVQAQSDALAKAEIAAEKASRAQYNAMVKMYSKEESEAKIAEKLRANAEFRVLVNEESAIKREAAAEGAALDRAYLAEQKAYVTQMAAMKKMYMAEDKAAEATQNEFIRAARAEGIARDKAYMAEQRIQRQQMAAMATMYRAEERAAGIGGGGVGARNVAFMGQGIEQILGIRIPFGFNRILSILPAVQAAMLAAFDVLVIVAFADIIYQVGVKINELITDWEGFGEAAKKAWDEADKGAMKAQDDLIAYNDKMRKLNLIGAKGPEKSRLEEIYAGMKVEDITDTLGKEVDRLHILQGLMNDVKGENEKATTILDSMGEQRLGKPMQEAAIETLKSGAMEGIRTVDELDKKIVEVAEHTENLNDMKADGIYDLLKAHREWLAALDKEHDKQRKWRDEVHELPYRLPWFMGENPADSMSNQFGGPRVNRPSSMMFDQMNRPVPNMNRFSPRSGSPVPIGSSGGGSSPSATLHVQYAPVFKFDGMPADAMRFVRDEMEPILMADLQKNTRGVTDSLVRVLKSVGVDVHV